VNNYGEDIVKEVALQNIKIATGEHMMAGTVSANVIQIIGAKSMDKKVFMVGVESNVAQAAALYLAHKSYEVQVYGISEEDFRALQKRLKVPHQPFLSRAAQLSDGNRIGLWVVSEYVPEVNDEVPQGGEVIVCCDKDPVDQSKRFDLCVTKGKDPFARLGCYIIVIITSTTLMVGD